MDFPERLMLLLESAGDYYVNSQNGEVGRKVPGGGDIYETENGTDVWDSAVEVDEYLTDSTLTHAERNKVKVKRDALITKLATPKGGPTPPNPTPPNPTPPNPTPPNPTPPNPTPPNPTPPNPTPPNPTPPNPGPTPGPTPGPNPTPPNPGPTPTPTPLNKYSKPPLTPEERKKNIQELEFLCRSAKANVDATSGMANNKDAVNWYKEVIRAYYRYRNTEYDFFLNLDLLGALKGVDIDNLNDDEKNKNLSMWTAEAKNIHNRNGLIGASKNDLILAENYDAGWISSRLMARKFVLSVQTTSGKECIGLKSALLRLYMPEASNLKIFDPFKDIPPITLSSGTKGRYVWMLVNVKMSHAYCLECGEKTNTAGTICTAGNKTKCSMCVDTSQWTCSSCSNTNSVNDRFYAIDDDELTNEVIACESTQNGKFNVYDHTWGALSSLFARHLLRFLKSLYAGAAQSMHTEDPFLFFEKTKAIAAYNKENPKPDVKRKTPQYGRVSNRSNSSVGGDSFLDALGGIF